VEAKLVSKTYAAVPATDQEISDAYWDVEFLNEKKQRVRLAVGFLVAVLLAGAGVRPLAGLLKLDHVPAGQP
jgi:hypothetical protein